MALCLPLFHARAIQRGLAQSRDEWQRLYISVYFILYSNVTSCNVMYSPMVMSYVTLILVLTLMLTLTLRLTLMLMLMLCYGHMVWHGTARHGTAWHGIA